jgi:hypothetical protein
MGLMQRTKGSDFERHVAGLIVAAFKEYGITKKDCYRTPMSGGHPYADVGDLTMSATLLALLPVVVECKHTKSWNMSHLMNPPKMMMDWMDQVTKAAAPTNSTRAPLVVMRGNGTPILCAIPQMRLVNYRPHPQLLMQHTNGNLWVIMNFASFLQEAALQQKKVT